MPSRWLISVSDIDGRSVQHAGIHRFLAAALAEDAHTHGAPKGYSVAALTQHRDGASFEVRTIDDSVDSRLAELAPGEQIPFGHNPSRHATLAQATCVESRGWADLADWDGSTQWQLRLATPTVLRRGNLDQPWPEPASLLLGLQARWDRSGPTLGPSLTPRTAGRVAVTGVDITTRATRQTPVRDRSGRRTDLWGAIGNLEWSWPYADDAVTPATVHRLLQLALFTGMGAYTAHGLGEVSILVSRAAAPGELRRP